MGSPDLPKVLCVDDDQDVLDALRLTLRKHYQVTTAISGAEGLAKLRREGAFAVVLSDMRMPAMDGVGFLARVRDAAPDTVRMVLAGGNDMNIAVHAVNEGQIFRFLSKPCPPKQLLKAFEAAVQQFRLVSSERVLLEDTLRGSVTTLTRILALTNPAAFACGNRVKDIVAELAQKLGTPNAWEAKAATMLSQIGCVTLPRETTEKMYSGAPLSEEEQGMVDRLPEVANELLRDFPGLRGVREILALRDQHFDGRGTQSGNLIEEVIPPLGSRLLKIALDYDALEARGVSQNRRLAILRAREGAYDPRVLDALTDLLGPNTPRTRIDTLLLVALSPGMILVKDIVTTQGTLLIKRENEVTDEVLTHLGKFPSGSIKQPIRVVIAEAPDPAERADSGS